MLEYFAPSKAVRSLEDPLVKKILPRYVKTVDDEVSAKFQIAKRIEFELNKYMSDGELWLTHDRLMERFYQVKQDLDQGKLRLEDMKVPRLSLLDLKIMLTREIMKSCELCEMRCKINRLDGEISVCKVGNKCLISSQFIHMGEEPHIVPSITIFFMGCNFKCQYCQNWTISQFYERAIHVSPKMLAKNINGIRNEGCRNVNFVGGEPTPSLLWVLETLKFVDVNIPTIWNSNMYMSEMTMRILDGVIDMYLSDFKYGNNECALRLSKVLNYIETCTRNHLLAAKQAEITLRHLILPNHVDCCTKPVLKWISENIRDNCLVNLMDQYRPEYKAEEYPDINRNIDDEEFHEVINYARDLKLNFISK